MYYIIKQNGTDMETQFVRFIVAINSIFRIVLGLSLMSFKYGKKLNIMIWDKLFVFI